MIADGAYSGKENQELVDSRNTHLVTTALTGKAASKIYADFQFSEDKTKVLSCPMGNVPIKMNAMEPLKRKTMQFITREVLREVLKYCFWHPNQL